MTLNYGSYGIFLILGNAGLKSSTVGFRVLGADIVTAVRFQPTHMPCRRLDSVATTRAELSLIPIF